MAGYESIDLRPDKKIILNPRKFESDHKSNLVFSGRPDYLGMAYFASLDRLERLKSLNAPDEIINEEKQLIEERLKQAQKQLKAILKSDPQVGQLIDEYPVPPELKKRIINQEQEPSSSFHEALTEAKPEDFARFLKWNRDYIQGLTEKEKPTIERIKKEYFNRIKFAIYNQNLPVPISQVKTRLKRVKIDLTDPLAMQDADLGGYYSAFELRIAVAAIKDRNYLRRILYHELTHLISGHTIVKSRYINYGDQPALEEDYYEDLVDRHRVGMNYKFGDGTKISRRWMNEAITEQLTQILLSDDGYKKDFSKINVMDFFSDIDHQGSLISQIYGSYLKERHLLRAFLPKNNRIVPAMLGAYFEDHLPTTPPGQRTTMRRLFINELKKAHGNVVMAKIREMDELYEKGDWLALANYVKRMQIERIRRLIIEDLANTH